MTQELVVFEPAEDQRGTMFGDPLAFQHAVGVAGVIAQSSFVPTAFRGKVGDVVIAVDMAQRLKLSPMMVLQNLVVVHGTPSWKAAFLIALAQARGWDVDYEVEDLGPPVAYKTKDGASAKADNLRVRCLLRRGSVVKRGVPVTTTQAIAAGWANNVQYTHSTELMLRYRAAAFAVRQFEPAAMLGLMTDEEAAVLTVEPEAEPQPASARSRPKTIDALVEQVTQAPPSTEASAAVAGEAGNSAGSPVTASPAEAETSGGDDGGASGGAAGAEAEERAALLAELKATLPGLPEAVREQLKIDHGLQRVRADARLDKLRALVADVRAWLANLERTAEPEPDRDETNRSGRAGPTTPPPEKLDGHTRTVLAGRARKLEKHLGAGVWQDVRRELDIGIAVGLDMLPDATLAAYAARLEAIDSGSFDDEVVETEGA